MISFLKSYLSNQMTRAHNKDLELIIDTVNAHHPEKQMLQVLDLEGS